jgi:hypothetical protein
VTWKLTAAVLSDMLFITVVEAFFSALGCNYHDHQAHLIEDSDVRCWTGGHRGIALFSLYALMYAVLPSHRDSR